jgi:hypothetical protein
MKESIRELEDGKIEAIQSEEQTEKSDKGVCPEESLGHCHAYQCLHQRNLRERREKGADRICEGTTDEASKICS